jgi:hypothetical protein
MRLDSLKLEEILDHVTPLVDLGVDRQSARRAVVLRDDDLGAALIEVGNDGIAVKGLVCDEAVKGETVDERSNADRIETMAEHENEADEMVASTMAYSMSGVSEQASKRLMKTPALTQSR